ncbi:MAG: hypothetical protein RR842_13690 [Gordonibacter sp.]|uniref:hypothetical protein n=1 Tax=Gordonibacter sp. TaxID=1968902 RepID=UPI002FC7DF0C
MSSKGGRTSRYNELMGMLPLVRMKLEEGMTEKEVCRDIGFAWSTWSRYKVDHAEFAKFIKDARKQPSDEVRAALFTSALGHTHLVQRAMKVKRIEYKDGKRLSETEDVIHYTEEQYFPPNVTAGIFLLTNWRPDEYARDAAALKLKERELGLKEKRAEEEAW